MLTVTYGGQESALVTFLRRHLLYFLIPAVSLANNKMIRLGWLARQLLKSVVPSSLALELLT